MLVELGRRLSSSYPFALLLEIKNTGIMNLNLVFSAHETSIVFNANGFFVPECVRKDGSQNAVWRLALENEILNNYGNRSKGRAENVCSRKDVLGVSLMFIL